MDLLFKKKQFCTTNLCLMIYNNEPFDKSWLNIGRAVACNFSGHAKRFLPRNCLQAGSLRARAFLRALQLATHEFLST